jgi:Tfp pilus assembly protein PilV
MRSTQAQGVPHARAVPLRPELSAEHGVTLVETLISAAILIVVLFSVLATIDTASSTTAVNRARTVAAALAEQDQERMRGMRAIDLSNYSESRPVDQGPVRYTVESRSEWVRDATGGAESCTANSRQADYMRITSTVTSPVAGTRIKPVQMSSLVAPRVGSFGPNQGTLAVQVKNELDGPVPGMPVSITGPTGLNDVTNQQGCAVFGRIPTGSYAVHVSRPGWVDPAGNLSINTSGTVSAGTVSSVPVRYAQAAAVTVSFDTRVGGAPQGETSPSISAANAGVPGGVRVFPAPGDPGTAAGSIVAKDLFPFPDGYSFYSGTCADSAPTKLLPDYYASNPGFLKVGAGGNASVSVREPALNLRITDGPNENSASPFEDAYVVITSTAPGCSDKYVFNGLRPNGTLPKPGLGLPFGPYTICADDRNVADSADETRYVTLSGVVSKDPGGLPLLGDGTPQAHLRVDHIAGPLGRCN